MRHELRDLFERLKLTALYVTHDQEEALVLSHRIAVMQAGRIVQLGPPMEIYKEPTNLFVAGFVGTTNLFNGRISRNNGCGEPGIVTTAAGEFRCRLPARLGQGERVSLIFRPEAVRIYTTECDAKPNALPGRVRRIVFTGNRVEYEIDVGQSHVRADSNPYITPLEKDQTIWLEVPMDRINVLAA
jgi:ABC-type Fe3+/spermidine/putrescine transport system ATPase subunit